MSLKERLADFEGSVSAAATRAPDEYPDWGHWSYVTHMADLKELWTEIRPQLKRDLDHAALIDAKLEEMFAAFEAGEEDKGRDAAWAIYNLKVERLR
ncbi:hypothetical protein [Eleftheria terrae]|uniref:hypothetical protein n=1 Tax=Eleftheria terrae TaxID=1597781 RepID=UPI00263BDD05|nr:hypothetical protein [Eleftheria terrae]WKB56026.1 hypothetical protein N7L95_28585 [Eleftheria terrae]